MGIFDKYKQQSALSRLQEERLFAFVLEELENDQTKPGLYAQALVEAEGDEKKVSAFYIKLRVQSLKDEFTIEQLIAEEYRKAEKNIAQQKLRDEGIKREYRGYKFEYSWGAFFITSQPAEDRSEPTARGQWFPDLISLEQHVDKRVERLKIVEC